MPEPAALLARGGGGAGDRTVSEVSRRGETLELLRRMEQAGALGPTHLDLSQRLDLDIDNFEAVARFLGRLHDGSKWWIADLLLEAEARFGESSYQIAAATGRSERTLGNWIYVASKVPRSRRREELSFTHHALVAPLDCQAQSKWLQRAVDERLSSRELRDAVNAGRVLEDRDAKEDCAGFETAVDDLHSRACACFGPVSVEVLVRAPGIEYRIAVGGED